MYILPSLKTTGNKLSEIKKKNPSNAWKSQEKKNCRATEVSNFSASSIWFTHKEEKNQARNYQN